MTLTYLQRIKAFLEREVCGDYRLKAWHPDDADRFELVAPSVHTGWEPVETGGARLEGKVPGIVVGVSGPIVDDGEKRLIPVCLSLIVCAAGSVLPGKGITPDRTGYYDLLNLGDRVVYAVRNAAEVGEGMVLDEPRIEFEPDNESMGDLWLGLVSFALRAAPGPRAASRDLI